jgi:hypothetical protein
MADKLNDLISEELDTHDAAAQAERDATALENAATVAEQVASEHKANRHIWRNSTGKKHRTGRGRGRARRRGPKNELTAKNTNNSCALNPPQRIPLYLQFHTAHNQNISTFNNVSHTLLNNYNNNNYN